MSCDTFVKNYIVYIKIRTLFPHGKNRSAGATVAFKLALYM